MGIDYVAEELNDNYTAAVFVYYNTGYQGFYEKTSAKCFPGDSGKGIIV